MKSSWVSFWRMADGYPAEAGAAKLDRYFTTESAGQKRAKALYRKKKAAAVPAAWRTMD
jgi:hypothetical protein